eukprot:5625018-Prymnesium_polylepis.2
MLGVAALQRAAQSRTPSCKRSGSARGRARAGRGTRQPYALVRWLRHRAVRHAQQRRSRAHLRFGARLRRALDQ